MHATLMDIDSGPLDNSTQNIGEEERPEPQRIHIPKPNPIPIEHRNLRQSIMDYIREHSIVSGSQTLLAVSCALNFSDTPIDISKLGIPLTDEWAAPNPNDERQLNIHRRLSVLLFCIKRIKQRLGDVTVSYVDNKKTREAQIDLAHAEYEAKITAHRLDFLIITRLYAFVDAHMPLLNALEYMRENNLKEADVIDIFTIFAPNLKYSLTALNMPRLNAALALAMLNAYNDTNNARMIRKKFPDMDENDFNVLKFIVGLVHKIIPNRSNIRRPHTSMRKNCLKSNDFCTVTLKIMAATFLGIYPTSATHPPIGVRIKTYKLFYQNHTPVFFANKFNDSELAAKMAIYAGKEYYTHMISQIPAMKSVIMRSYNWKSYEVFMHIGTERIRHPENTDLFSLVDLSDIHVIFCQTQYKTNINYDLRTIMHVCKGLNLTRYIIPEGMQIIPGRYHELPHPDPVISKEDTELIRKICHLFIGTENGAGAVGKRRVPFDWLMYFGVSPQTLNGLHRAVYAKKPTFRKFMSLVPLDEYRIIYTFFDQCAQLQSEAEYPVDAHMYHAQCIALMRNMDIRNDEEIPHVTGMIQVCTSCRNFKMTSPFTKDTIVRTVGTKSNSMIMTNGVTVCSCKPQDATWREKYFIEHKEHPPSKSTKKVSCSGTEMTKKRKLSKTIAMKIDYSKCQITPLKRVNMIGKMFYYWNNAHLACMDDFHVCPFENMRYYSNRVVCKRCYNKRMTKVSEDRGEFIPIKQTLFNDEETKDANAMPIIISEVGLDPDEFEDAEDADAEPIPSASREMEMYSKAKAKSTLSANRNKRHVDPCEYCGKKTNPDRRSSFFLYDDDPHAEDVRRMRNMFFCHSHGPLGWIKTHEYTHKSRVIDAIFNGKHSEEYCYYRANNKPAPRRLALTSGNIPISDKAKTK